MASIQNAEAVTDVFGYWPSFHDAEVVSLCLDRDLVHGANLEAKIHAYDVGPELDNKGYYVIAHETLVHFRFLGLADLILEGFNHQNVLAELTIEDVTATEKNVSFAVTLDASYGCGAIFKCQSVAVLSATPYTHQ